MTGSLTILIIILFAVLFVLAIAFFFLWQFNNELQEQIVNDKRVYEALEEVAREQSRMIEKQNVQINFLSATHRN